MQTFPQTMKLEVSAEGRLQYDPHAAPVSTDAQDLASARSAWSARKIESSLVAWTLSPEWLEPNWIADPDPEWDSALWRGHVSRMLEICRTTVYYRNGEIVSGEFTAATCACHRPDGRPW